MDPPVTRQYRPLCIMTNTSSIRLKTRRNTSVNIRTDSTPSVADILTRISPKTTKVEELLLKLTLALLPV